MNSVLHCIDSITEVNVVISSMYRSILALLDLLSSMPVNVSLRSYVDSLTIALHCKDAVFSKTTTQLARFLILQAHDESQMIISNGRVF